jgi:hypothetical protein
MKKSKPQMDLSQPWWALLFGIQRIEADVSRIATAQERTALAIEQLVICQNTRLVLAENEEQRAKAEAARKAEIAKAFTLGGTDSLLDGFKRKRKAYCESADGKSYSHKARKRNTGPCPNQFCDKGEVWDGDALRSCPDCGGFGRVPTKRKAMKP